MVCFEPGTTESFAAAYDYSYPLVYEGIESSFMFAADRDHELISLSDIAFTPSERKTAHLISHKIAIAEK